MKITNAELKFMSFSSEDVIATSGMPSLTGLSRSFYIPSSQFSGGSFSSDYVEFNGTIGANTGNGYEITNIYGAKAADDEEREGLMSGGSVVFMGVTIPASPEMETFSQQYFDAYSYGGTYYTNGLSYYDQYWQ